MSAIRTILAAIAVLLGASLVPTHHDGDRDDRAAAAQCTTATPTPSPAAAPPPVAPPPPVVAPPDGQTAAARLGWGAPIAGDEFNGTGVDQAKWGLYDSAGHAGNGLRRPAQITEGGGALTIAGTANGTTGGMAWHGDTLHARWELRMRIPHGDSNYHPVALLWVANDTDWPCKGEIDYAETTAAATGTDFFLHYSCANQQTHANAAVDLTAWHSYAVDWTAGHVTGYIDGQQWFTDTAPAHIPPGPMHPTLQLDGFSGTGPYLPSSMQVDWIRQYTAA